MTDQELVQKTYSGDEEAFTEIYRLHQSSIFRFSFHMTGSRTGAEDVTQEVFLTMLRFQNYDASKGPLAAYLFGIARHHVARWLRKNRSYVALPILDAETIAPAPDLSHQQRIEDVRAAILTLPIRYREAVILCDLEEKTYEQASRILGCAIGTLRSRLHRARKLLLKKLTKSGAAEKNKGASYELPAL